MNRRTFGDPAQSDVGIPGTGVQRVFAWRVIFAVASIVANSAAAALEIPSLPKDAAKFLTPVSELVQADQLMLNTPDGHTLQFKINTNHPQDGMTGVLGNSPSGERLYVFVAGSEILSADIYGDGVRYRLVSFENRPYWVHAEDVPNATQPAPIPEMVAQGASSGTSPMPAVASPGADGNYEVDLLILYTPTYAARMGGDPGAQKEAQRLAFLANGYFQTSKVPIRYRIVGVMQYSGAPEGSSQFFDDIVALRNDRAIHDLREATGADLVALFREDDGECGLSAGFNQGDHSDPPRNVNAEGDAFVIIGAAPDKNGFICADTEHIFAHELGHNFGGGHQWLGDVGTYWKPYAHAWQCGVAASGKPYWTIMTGNVQATTINNPGPGTVNVQGEPKSDLFSSPALSQMGMPCGVAAGPEAAEATQADNARAIADAAPYVAAYRSGKSAGLQSSESIASSLSVGSLDESAFAFFLLLLTLKVGARWAHSNRCRPTPSRRIDAPRDHR